jgi:hypothetical protein
MVRDPEVVYQIAESEVLVSKLLAGQHLDCRGLGYFGRRIPRPINVFHVFPGQSRAVLVLASVEVAPVRPHAYARVAAIVLLRLVPALR